jgi:CheY-like chemotaxis protein
MTKQFPGPPGLASQVTVLSVGPSPEDYESLQAIFENSKWNLCPNSKWKLVTRPTVESAIALLRKGRIPVVLCAHDLLPGTWRDLLDQLHRLPNSPALVVTSRMADDGLWAEALNLGAYDVLAKPFDSAEVVRAVSLAWLNRINPPHGAAQAARWSPDPETAGTLPAWPAFANAAGGSNGLRNAV